MTLRIGTSGWTYPEWRDRLYAGVPRRRWLATYAAAFDAVEVNGSFYRLPLERTFAAWAEAVPADFRFAVKGSRYVTHHLRLRDTRDSVALVTGRARALGSRLGPMVWQLRADLAYDDERVARFLDTLPSDLRHVIEARHPSWACDAARRRLCDAGVAFCNWDLLGVRWREAPTADFAFVRFHGTTRKYGGTYGEAALAPWAADLGAWRDRGHEVWAFFNNDLDGHAIEDARRLRALLGDQAGAATAASGDGSASGAAGTGTRSAR